MFFLSGDPLSGPSAVDAVMAGCVYLNPVFTFPMKKIYNSQHPFLAQNVGEPYVCSFEEGVRIPTVVNRTRLPPLLQLVQLTANCYENIDDA